MKRRNVKRIVVACLAIAMMVLFAGPIAAQRGKIKLSYWHFLGGDIGKRHEQFVGEFNKAHANIEVVPLYSHCLDNARQLLVSVAGKAAGCVYDRPILGCAAHGQRACQDGTLMDGLTGLTRMISTELLHASVDGEIWTCRMP